jgi:hypothetical protein
LFALANESTGKLMQKLRHMLDNIASFNAAYFNKGFYYYWDPALFPRAMRHNSHTSPARPRDLQLACSFDERIGFAGDYVINFKRCTAHDLPLKQQITDSWDRPAVEVLNVAVAQGSASKVILPDLQTVVSCVLQLNTNNATPFTIRCAGFYWKKILPD